MSEIYSNVEKICIEAKQAVLSVCNLTNEEKNNILLKISEELKKYSDDILSANCKDVNNAASNGVLPHMIDRLKLDNKRIDDICSSIKDVADMDDPCQKSNVWTRPNGLVINCKKVPIGVVAMVYEARPNVTVDAVSLCLKSGNCVILRGGKEAIETNRCLVDIIHKVYSDFGLPTGAVGLIDDITREGTNALFEMKKYVDVLIPRGSKALISAVAENSKIPVIETGAGNCHIYISQYADLDMAEQVAYNAKMSRPSVCNAIETILVNKSVAEEFLIKFDEMTKGKLEIRGDENVCKILPNAVKADESDWETEYDDYIVAVKIVDNVDEAVNHINKYGTKHSEAIITKDDQEARTFCDNIDSACVYVNASTRFTDGGEFGFGAEIGISTQKLHVRGPMGIEALTTVKYVIEGNGQVR